MSENEILKNDAAMYIQKIEDFGELSITPADRSINLHDGAFKKLELSKEEKSLISQVIGVVPSAASSFALSKACIVEFPKGVVGTLMKLKRGGNTTAIMNNNSIVAQASLHSISPAALTPLVVFEAMSFATGQYFMTEINRELKMMNLKIDKVLDFLYGDKRSELLAEISFVQSVFRNYRSIMTHDEQRVAVIASLQAARKIAMKDIEFYLTDLDSKSYGKFKDASEIKTSSAEIFKIKESLELSMQLFVAAYIAEIHVAQNYDDVYLSDVRSETEYFLKKCQSRIHGNFSAMLGKIQQFEQPESQVPMFGLKKADPELPLLKEKYESIKVTLNNGEDSELVITLRSAFKSFDNSNRYYMSEDGDLYLRK